MPLAGLQLSSAAESHFHRAQLFHVQSRDSPQHPDTLCLSRALSQRTPLVRSAQRSTDTTPEAVLR